MKIEKMLLGGDEAIAFLGIPRKSDDDIRKDYAIGLLSRSDALKLLGYDLDDLSDNQEDMLDPPPLPPQTEIREDYVDPFFWDEGDLPEFKNKIIAINYEGGGVLGIGFPDEEKAIAAFERLYDFEIETFADVSDLVEMRVDTSRLDKGLTVVRGNLCRDARGRFVSCGTPTTKIESSLAKKRRENKEQRAKDLDHALKNTDFSDHEQVERLGRLFTAQHVKSTKPTPKEKALFKQKTDLGKQLIEETGKASPDQIKVQNLVNEFKKAEIAYEYAVDRRLERLNSQFRALRVAIVFQNGGLSKTEARAIAKQATYDSSLGTIIKKRVEDHYTEYTHLSGGKGSASIKRLEYSDPRAHADTGYINVGEGASSTTFFHEAAHHLEFEYPDLKKAAQGWRAKRATSPNPEKLSKLTGDKRYKDREVALPDKFISPYVGKVYSDGCTEVLSMGLQHFVNSLGMQELYEKDRSHFEFSIGAILKPKPRYG